MFCIMELTKEEMDKMVADALKFNAEVIAKQQAEKAKKENEKL